MLHFLRLHMEKSVSWNTFDILLVGLISTLIAWYIQYHWKRRRLYELASQIDGPFSWPIIGSALYFFGSPTYIFNNIIKIFDSQPEIVKVWFGSRLFYAAKKPEHLEILLNSPKSLAKTDLYKYARKVGGTGLFTADIPKWKKHRKIIMPTFNQRILNSFVEIFSEKNINLIEKFKEYSGKGEFDIFPIISKCNLEIVCETAMGVKINAQTTSVADWVDTIFEIMFLRMFVLWYHFDFIFSWTKLYKQEEEAASNLHNLTGTIIKERRIEYEQRMKQESCQIDEPNKRKAFLDLLLELSSEGVNFTDEEIRDEVVTLVVAGTDTTASSSCFALTMIGMHYDVQQKIFEEVLDVLGPERCVEYADLPNLKYTERVIKEVLRLFPVGAFIVRYISEDLSLGKYTLPEGSSAVLGFFQAHRDPEYWPNPLVFDPDRFLPEKVAKRHPYAYVPFSGGPRNCIGPKYAMMAMKTMVASIVRKYRIYTDYKTVEDVKLKTHLVLRPCDGFKVSLELRT